MKKILALLLALVLVFAFAACAKPSESETPADAEPVAEVNPLADKRVRQALLYALDRESFIEAEYGSTDIARVGLAPMSPTSWAFPDESELNAYSFDLEKAGALLDEAGWLMGDDGVRYKDGQKLELSWLVYTDSPWPGTLSGMAYDTWGQIGVVLNIELMDFDTVASRTMDAAPADKDFDIYTMGFSLSVDPDPKGALFDYEAYTEGGFNASGYLNEEAQQLIADGRATFDTAERAEIYKKWVKLMNEEVPTVIVAYRSEIWGINDRVSGLDIDTYHDWVTCQPNITLEGDQTLKMGVSGYDGTFNPIMTDNVYDTYVCDSIFQALIALQPDGEYTGSAIADYVISEDGSTYTFTLKDGVKFADGTPMTAEDVYFTYSTIAHPEYNGPRAYAVSTMVGYDDFHAGTAETFEGIKVVDDKTVAFTFAEPSPANIESFTYGILSKDYYAFTSWDEFLALNDKPLGSGLFTLDSWAAKQYISLKANTAYWDAANAAKIEGVLLQEVADEAILPSLQTGDIDFGQPNASFDNAEGIKAMDGVHLDSYLGNGYTFMCFNCVEK